MIFDGQAPFDAPSDVEPDRFRDIERRAPRFACPKIKGNAFRNGIRIGVDEVKGAALSVRFISFGCGIILEHSKKAQEVSPLEQGR
jgi:hypothetical protein